MDHIAGSAGDPTASALEGVGVSADAARLYRAMVRSPTSGPAELSLQVGVSMARFADLLAQLAVAGLVRDGQPANGEAGAEWVPLEPRSAIGALVRRRQEELDSAVRGAEALSVEFAEAMLRSHPSTLVDVIDGAERIVATLANLTMLARREVAVLDAPPYVDVSASLQLEQSLMRRGIASRVVYATAALELPDRYKAIRQLVEAGERARVLPAIPLKLVIVDAKHALLPLSVEDGKIRSAVVVQPSVLSSALFALFESLWSQAMPVLVERERQYGSGLDAIDRRLITLLASGLKDDVIARELRISSRTLGRRITHLLSRLGANSRFQAGVKASERGWL